MLRQSGRRQYASSVFKIVTVVGSASVGALAGLFVGATYPAAPAAALEALSNGVNSVVTCATTTACSGGSNTSTGPGVAGSSAKGIAITASGVSGLKATGTTGIGVSTSSTSGSGLQATSKSGVGVKATSTSNDGVSGTTTSGLAGVLGTANGFGSGLYGTSTRGQGVTAFSNGSTSIYASTGSPSANPAVAAYGHSPSGTIYGEDDDETGKSAGVYGLSAGTAIFGDGSFGSGLKGTGVYGRSANGTGIIGAAGTGVAVKAEAGNNIALAAYNESTVVGTVTAINYSPAGTAGDFEVPNEANSNGQALYLNGGTSQDGYVITGVGANGNFAFIVDNVGNVQYTGNLIHFASFHSGLSVQSFGTMTTAPTVEDTGTAQLVGGSAAVRLDPAFMASIEPTNYHVFLTPDGETRGSLYVATKSANGFIVRENEGGRSTVSFDYRIVATKLGNGAKRMAFVAAPSIHRPAALPTRQAFPVKPGLHPPNRAQISPPLPSALLPTQ